MKNFVPLFFTIVMLIPGKVQAQPSTGQEIQDSYQQRSELAKRSLVKNYTVRSIGPVVQGGRIADLAVIPDNPQEYYVGYASGGIFKTVNNGISFEPIFDNQGALGIGDLALAPSNSKVLYVGTGENNSSRSSYAGNGMYRTLDQGETWEYLGLSETQHIGAIVVHPENEEVVWVAAIGALYTHSSYRGVYKTTDGGKTWDKTLFINDSTGIIDLIINPGNPDQLWAAAWERTRKAWDFKGQGPGSGIYRSDDGGDTWRRLENGFPQNQEVGRIGLGISQQSPHTLYALMDNQQESKAPRQSKHGELIPIDFAGMSAEQFEELDTTALRKYLKEYEFPSKYSTQKLKEMVRQRDLSPKALADYLGDANRALFDTEVTGAELYQSLDYGDSWTKANTYPLEGVYFTYGYYFGEVRVDPTDADILYVFGVPLLKSQDGGKTFHRLDSIGDVHVDHQALWINPTNSNHLLLGNDGGLYLSYDQGANWLHLNNTAVGQFYTVNVDLEKPYNVYGGLQDNGVLKGSSKSVPNRTKKWERIMGGDGMFVTADPRDNTIVYSGYQFGHYFRIDLTTGKRQKITPKHDLGEQPFRFNWRTPLVRSRHHADILYLGSNKVHRSMDHGDSWQVISPDLTGNLPQGNVPFSTITTIEESPLKFGLLYIGTDDGKVQVTKGGGDTWQLISGSLPDRWVSSIQASPHLEGRVYLSLNGYREDEFKTMVYFSDDYGGQWHPINGNLPEVVVNVIKQDPVNPQLLYLGTDHGAYVSFDHGSEWQLITGIPNVAVYDLLVHPRDRELVIATHGRSIYVLNVKPWQELTPSQIDSPVLVFETDPVRHQHNWGEAMYPWSRPNHPHKRIVYYVGKAKEDLQAHILNRDGQVVKTIPIPGDLGFHHFDWDLKTGGKSRSRDKTNDTYAQPGTYRVIIENQGSKSEISFEIKPAED